MIYIGKGGGQFSAARSGAGYDDYGFIGFGIFVGTVENSNYNGGLTLHS